MAETATLEKTQNYFKKFKSLHPTKVRDLNRVQVSALGVGTYLGDFTDETDTLYQEALIKAYAQGVNHIDTAINYRAQRSERLIGDLFKQKKIKRDEVFVASKAGFIPFDRMPPTHAIQYIQDQWVKSKILKEEDIVGHCHSMHPQFLKKSLEMTLENLNLKTLDLYYLHNPEVEKAHFGEDVFFKKLKKAFEFLEEQVACGSIESYGMATWTGFREEIQNQEYLDLARVLETARRVAGDQHHFKAIQLPYNLAMLEGVSVANQKVDGELLPTIAAAHMQGLEVMVSAPLLQNQLASLPGSLIGKIPGDLTPAQNALQFVMSTPGVSSVLVGQKTPAHLQENSHVLTVEDWNLATLKKIGSFLMGV